ncbi:VapC toxin family PIN domain ribonuclease [Coraliomargarita sinensis]|uniref:VapC toxin family PIN domain ribonuclease n=1 Tax=Coraliomargarita sinensis TaxID=2174842 RepID=A0A317ZI68_9BACT|nr:PIN domain-containing protein [Coraliomargarita sinensis]PXA03469.1 VapC toxin family PIN domain ribonuclease [Coraliomargarita sinensis]
MSADYFLDTNVLVYAFDQTAPEKQARARELIEIEHNWSISWHVLQEFSSVALHRFAKPVSPHFLKNFIELVLWPKCQVMPSQSLYQNACDLHAHTQYRYYDSLILAAAIESGATRLYSEDFQDGRPFGSLIVQDPFQIGR